MFNYRGQVAIFRLTYTVKLNVTKLQGNPEEGFLKIIVVNI